ncbi:MAG TPA: EAL domain-containing protein [Pseudomonadales bacterium]|nr:EAL domain-containing protein [Pseudomonadales bacterium]
MIIRHTDTFTAIRALRQVVEALSLEADFEAFFRKAAGAAADLVGADAAALILLNDDGQLEYQFFLGVPDGYSDKFLGYRFGVQAGVAGEALTHRRPVFVPDYPAHPGAIAEFVASGLRANLAVPLHSAGEAVGVLVVSWFRNAVHAPDQALLSLLSTISAQVGLAHHRWRLEQRLEHRANHDDLTGLPNRGHFLERLQQAVADGRRYGRRYALMVIDLDGFKAVNDRAGHAVGDALLRDVAQGLREVVRGGDVIARLGGDEFVLLMEFQSWPEEPATVAARVKARLTLRVAVAGGTTAVTPSIGIAAFPEDGDDAGTLLANADLAMYEAKRRHGEREVCFFNRSIAQAVRQREVLLEEVEQALNDGRFVLHYQPIVELPGGHMVAVEALLRWPQPDGSLRPPVSFIPDVERHSRRLMVALGRYVLRSALAQAAAWHRQGHPIAVSVNVSAREFLEEGFLASLTELLADHGDLPRERLMLEITETAALEDLPRAQALMQACRELGVRFAIDDFGAGHASLANLRELPVDRLKIDRAFVAGLPDADGDRAVVQAILAVAKAFGVGVVAEGVERSAQSQTLQELGCRVMQGYHFARPMPAALITERLDAERQASPK